MEALGVQRQMVASESPRRLERCAFVCGEIIRLVLASALLFTGLSKLRAPYEFLISVYGYELTGPLTSLIVATVVPWLEVVTAICLWGKLCYRGALAMTILLMAVFTTVVAIALYRQLDISCGCFISSDKIGYSTFIRSTTLLSISIIGLILASRNATQSSNV
jgi:hypothetical protein